MIYIELARIGIVLKTFRMSWCSGLLVNKFCFGRDVMVTEKFEFDIEESKNAIHKILKIAEKYNDNASFEGQLAKNLLALSSIINDNSFVNGLNVRLITCRNHSALKLVRAWEGGLEGFKQDDEVIRLHRLALFLVIYLREQSFRANDRVDQGSYFYSLNKLVRENRNEFIERSS